ncbi:MAG: oligopeptide transport system permease protein [Chlamydiales bacterium]|jgi:oligopeptide transport system permease protein
MARVRSRWDFASQDTDRLLAEARELRGESLWTDAWRRLRADRPAFAALLFLMLFALGSWLTPVWPLRSPVRSDLDQALIAPHLDTGDSQFLERVPTEEHPTRSQIERSYWELNALDHGLVRARLALFGRWQTGHWLGTDQLGRDILARIAWGSRTSILVALAATACSLLIGVLYGAFAGLMGGRIDNAMMRLVDILYSIPFIFLVIFLVTLIGDHRALLEERYGLDREKVFFIIIGAVYWLTMARVVRGQVLSLKKSEFIQAARVLGASTTRILFTHIVPNVVSIVIIYLTLTIPAVMLFEAFLSYLGLGIEPPKVSWGLLAADGIAAINPLRIFWWIVVFPAAAMGSTLLALNVLGDGLRDALDPKLRGGR